MKTPSKTIAELHEVLGLVRIETFGPWWWQSEELDEPTIRGRIFRCYEPGSPKELAYLLAGDVSGDPDEPDVAQLTPELVMMFDRQLEALAREMLPSDGRRMVRWMSSQLNLKQGMSCLVTAYIAEDAGRDRQYIDARIKDSGQKLLLAGCFDTKRSAELAAPVMRALQEAVILRRIPTL